MLELDRRIAFDPGRAEEFLQALPARSAVVLVEPRAELAAARPLLLRTADLRRRLGLLFGPRDAALKRINLRDYAQGVRFRLTGSPFEQTLVHWQQARALWPGNYRERLGMRPPPVVKISLANPYPRAIITRRITSTGAYFGPFASRRSAETFLEPLLDLFRIRRCQIKIRRDPQFPGCIYSEMKMCLAPCFAGCSAEEYAAEVQDVRDFLDTRGASLSNRLARERDAASAETDFERAANAHRRLEKTGDVLRLMPDLVRCISELDAIVLQRAAESNGIAVFLVRAGRISDPFPLGFDKLATQPRSVEGILRDFLEPAASVNDGAVADVNPATVPRSRGDDGAAAELEDHLAILGRWFYGRPRQGEIFIAEGAPARWPYRRILRACSRLLAPEKPEAKN